MHKEPTITPSLDELNQSDMPAFLWDGGRRRVVWANSPGIHYFAADSLFDLIERRFGAGDAGAAGLGEIAGEIHVGEMREEELSFASLQIPLFVLQSRSYSFKVN